MGREDRSAGSGREWQSNCIYCGGANPAVQVDRFPPTALFTGGYRPKGEQFEICADCDEPIGTIDQIAAAYCRLVPDSKSAGNWKCLQDLAEIHPDILALFAERADRPNGSVRLPRSGPNAARLQYAMHAFCGRIGLALYRRRVGRPAAPDMRIYTYCYSADQVQGTGGPDQLFQTMGDPTPGRSGDDASCWQFLFDTFYDEGPTGYFVAIANVRHSFCPFVLIRSQLPGMDLDSDCGAVFRPGFLKGLDYRDVGQWETRRREGLLP